ncbi:hypothetical protein [Arthrobacter woluwensis]|uniref:Uncharacterized protein n=1 Tax=Arthrobacter woluwensis TaxID=156980 RepID=A0A1H4I820_9MICC|nr:hypothetical protein [Arthrobacter woluwensis]SEB29439.1 hypothetical protein SAMN04489745_0050 [Arthrobacter woluwensis]SEB30234.1 hypothetical protein SAMN04489745_0123 [Arthrobacter woluwensis]
MEHQAETPETEPQPSRRAKRIVTFGIPAVVIAGAIAGILVATNQPTAEPAAVATSQAPVATPSTTTASPSPKPTATKKPVAAKAKAKPAPKSTASAAQAPAAGSATSQSQPDTGTAEGQIPQAGAPAQGSSGGSGTSGSNGGGWVPAPAPAAPAPKPAAPKPAPAPAPVPAPQPPVQENHYPPQTLSSINAARMGLGAPGFVPFTGGCVQVASAWGSTLDGAEGYVIHPGVVGYQRAGMKIAGTFALDGQVNGRSGTLTVYSCP